MDIRLSRRMRCTVAVIASSLILSLSACAISRASATATVYRGWGDAVTLANPALETVAVPGISRIMHLSLPGQSNLFHVNPEWAGKAQDPAMNAAGAYRDFGGAKLWNAPQKEWRYAWGGWPPDYALDSAPSVLTIGPGDAITLVGAASAAVGVRYTRTLALDGDAVVNEVEMRCTSDHPISWGVWSVLCMRPEGTVYLPVPADARLWTGEAEKASPESYGWVRFGSVLVLAHPPAQGGQKLFCASSASWIGYLVDGQALFITYRSAEAVPAPAGEAGSEVYACPDFIELEHIGRLESLKPGAVARFSERWHLRPGPTSATTLAQRAAWMAATAASLR
jgi:hypothetical protein